MEAYHRSLIQCTLYCYFLFLDKWSLATKGVMISPSQCTSNRSSGGALATISRGHTMVDSSE
jgi:hypothetical protein